MSRKDILAQLLLLPPSTMARVIDSAFRRYAQLIADINNDIYDSCIELYYSTYTPTKYDRHGYPEGENLYNASEIRVKDTDILTDLRSSYLWPYYDGKKNRDKRPHVLRSVMNGWRGTKSRKMPPGWPKSWTAYYPNEYSSFDIWSSSGHTIDAIFNDWAKNGLKDTSDVLFEYLEDEL